METLATKLKLLLTENGQLSSLAKAGFVIATEQERSLKSTELNMSYMAKIIIPMYDH